MATLNTFLFWCQRMKHFFMYYFTAFQKGFEGLNKDIRYTFKYGSKEIKEKKQVSPDLALPSRIWLVEGNPICHVIHFQNKVAGGYWKRHQRGGKFLPGDTVTLGYSAPHPQQHSLQKWKKKKISFVGLQPNVCFNVSRKKAQRQSTVQ